MASLVPHVLAPARALALVRHQRLVITLGCAVLGLLCAIAARRPPLPPPPPRRPACTAKTPTSHPRSATTPSVLRDYLALASGPRRCSPRLHDPTSSSSSSCSGPCQVPGTLPRAPACGANRPPSTTPQRCTATGLFPPSSRGIPHRPPAPIGSFSLRLTLAAHVAAASISSRLLGYTHHTRILHPTSPPPRPPWPLEAVRIALAAHVSRVPTGLLHHLTACILPPQARDRRTP
ncbi:hypothetical protein ACCO45_007132 [Purpureocillium lilacinum]|uniref:Uncharacterized protein n=1 Tax=Purpureocillium lilacinum TaxID=33203 RepID=A0ACC4DUK0_PURLI